MYIRERASMQTVSRRKLLPREEKKKNLINRASKSYEESGWLAVLFLTNLSGCTYTSPLWPHNITRTTARLYKLCFRLPFFFSLRDQDENSSRS